MLYYMYNTTTRLTFISLLLMIPITMRRREINVSLAVVLYM
jgi:hypothetical protein